MPTTSEMFCSSDLTARRLPHRSFCSGRRFAGRPASKRLVGPWSAQRPTCTVSAGIERASRCSELLDPSTRARTDALRGRPVDHIWPPARHMPRRLCGGRASGAADAAARGTCRRERSMRCKLPCDKLSTHGMAIAWPHWH